ncbi:MAG: hypothetical protein AAB456_04340 [Patescibacteria group bacterium]
MAKVFRSREGTITAVDTKTQLTTLGSETAPGPLLVPAGAKKISAIITALACDLGNATGGTIFIRLEGPGLPEGPETLTVGGFGAQVATGGSYSMLANKVKIDIPVTASNEILIFAENGGGGLESTTVGVTLEFEM